MTKRPLIWHWRQDDAVKNFGDYLADFLVRELFLPVSAYDGPVHIIGSVIADFLIPESGSQDGAPPPPKVTFWGCGARDETGLSDDRLENARILAVRGPLTASALRVGAVVPQGDPAFLLPALYTPKPTPFTTGKSVCIPHFWDRRPDEELRAVSGCDVLLRTNIAGGKHDLRRLIDAIASADFVLTASLHGAVVAAAYNVPFAYWDNGHVDLPFKWKDLAAFLSIPSDFYGSLTEAREGYEKNIAPALKIPSLWPMLAVAPFPLRPSALTRLLNHELAQWPGELAQERLAACMLEFERRDEDAEEQAQAVTETIDALRESVRRIEAERGEALDEASKLRQSFDDLGGAYQAQAAQMQDSELAATQTAQARDKALAGELAAIAARQELQQRFDDLSGAYQAQAAQIRDGEQAVAATLQERDQAQANERAAIAARQDLQQRFDDLGDAYQAQAALIQERDKALAEAEEREQSAKARIDLLDERDAAIAREREALARRIEELEAARQARDKALEAARSRIANIEAMREAASQAHERDRAEILQTLTTFVDLATRLPNAIGDEGDNLPRDDGAFGETLAALRSAIRALQERSLGVEAANAKLSIALTEARNVQSAALSEVDDLRKAQYSLERRLDDADDRSRKSSETILTLQATTAALQAQLEAEQSKRSRVEAALQERERHLRLSFEEIAHLSRQTDAATKELAALTQVNAEAEMSLRLTNQAYAGIATSTTWLVARKITGLLGRLSPNARATLRHGLHRAVLFTRRLRGLEQAPVPLLPTAASARTAPPSTPSPPAAQVAPNTQVSHPPLDSGARGEDLAIYAFQKTEHASGLDAFIRATSASIVLVIDKDAAQVRGGVETFANLFEAHPMAVAACGVVLGEDGLIQSAGGLISDGVLVAADQGLDPTDYRLASVRPVDVLWPEFIAINVDAYLHIGGVEPERGIQEALMAFGLTVRERGLELVTNPFASAIRIAETANLQLPGDLCSRNAALVRKAKPKVLFTDAVTPTPDRDSGSQDIYWFMRIFQTLGYEVTFLPAQDLAHAGRYTDDLRMLGVFCPLSPQVEAGWMFLRDVGPTFQLMMMYRVSSACHLIDPARQFAPGAKIVFDTVDLHFLREMRAAEHAGSEEMMRAAERTKDEELRIMAMSDATILLSSMEFDHVGEIAPHVKRHLIPIVRPIPGRTTPAEGRKDMMFVGGFKHVPNIDAVQYLCADIWPKVRARLPEARLLIIGTDAPEDIRAFHAPANGVEFVGYVEDLAPYYNNVRINLAPLRYGAGLKGKVVASLSVGLPSVASPTAVEGMSVVDGQDILVGQDAEAFAEAAVRLYNDPDLWLKLSDNGVRAASEAFSIGAVRQRLEDLLESLGLTSS